MKDKEAWHAGVHGVPMEPKPSLGGSHLLIMSPESDPVDTYDALHGLSSLMGSDPHCTQNEKQVGEALAVHRPQGAFTQDHVKKELQSWLGHSPPALTKAVFLSEPQFPHLQSWDKAAFTLLLNKY